MLNYNETTSPETLSLTPKQAAAAGKPSLGAEACYSWEQVKGYFMIPLWFGWLAENVFGRVRSSLQILCLNPLEKKN